MTARDRLVEFLVEFQVDRLNSKRSPAPYTRALSSVQELRLRRPT